MFSTPYHPQWRWVIVLRFFSTTFVDDSRKWYNNLPDKGIKTWDKFHKVFMKIWGTKGDPKFSLLQLNELKKKENEYVNYFDAMFEMLLQQIPYVIIPKKSSLTFLYLNAYPG